MNIDAEQLQLTHQLQALLIDYWYDVDNNWGRNAAELFAVDGVWQGDGATFEGREGVRGFYKWREERGGRVVYHAVQNLRARFDGSPDKAICEWVMVLHGGTGEAPLASAPPIIIDFMTERWTLTDDGWKIQHRSSNVRFIGGDVMQQPPSIGGADGDAAGSTDD